MANKIKRFLEQLIHLGVNNQQEYTLQKRIILSNQMSYMMMAMIGFVAFSRVWFLQVYSTLWLSILEASLLFLVVFLNKKQYFTIGHTLLSVLPPIIVLFEVPLIKVLHGQPLPIAYQFVPRFIPIAFLLLPMLLIDLQKKALYWSCILLHITCLMLFDPVHFIMGVGYDKALPVMKHVPFMNLVILITILFLVIGFQFMQHLNHKYNNKNLLLLSKNAEQKEALKNTQKELKKNVILYQILTENSSDLIERFDRNHQLIYTSPSIERILGYTLQERKKIKLPKIAHPDDAHWLLQKIQENTTKKQKYSTYVFRARHKQGHYIWLEVVANAFFDSNGQYEGAISSTRDVSERMEAEKKLQANEERFRLAQNFANIGIWEWTPTNNEMLWSPQTNYLLGLYHQVGKPSYEVFMKAVHPDDQATVQAKMQHSVNTAKKYELEHRVIWEDGTIYWVKSQGNVQRDQYGNVMKMLGVIQNITQRKVDENKLKSSHKTLADFKMALDEATIVAIIDLQGNITYANDNFATISGYTTHELIGRHYDVLIPQRQVLSDEVLSMVQSGKVWQGETNNIHKSGKQYWLKTTIIPFLNDRKLPFQYMIICMDITDHKKAEETVKLQYLQIEMQNQELQATNEELRQTNEVLSSTMEQLRESEQRLSLATLSAKMGIWDWDLLNNHLVWDQQMFELYGCKPENFPNAYDAWEKHLHPDDKKQAYLDSLLAREGKAEYNTEFRVCHPNGNIRHIKGFGKVVFDDYAQPIRMIGINWDITTQKRAEEDLTNQKRILEQILDTLPINIYIKDDEGRLVFLNKATCQTYRVTKETLGKTDAEIFPEYLAKAFVKDDMLVRAGAKPDTWEEQISWQHLNIDLLVGKKLISFEKNKAPYILGYSLDITARKRFERELITAKQKAEEAALAKEQFLSTMSHEIRTPMNAVIGMTHVLLENKPRVDQLENLKILKFSAQTLLSLINDILDFTKIDSGKVEFEEVLFDLPELIESIQKSFAFTAQEKNIRLRFSTDTNIPHKVIGDPVRLTQVLTNLMNNAIKFTLKGEVKLMLQFIAQNNRQVQVRFTVKDTGVGIPKEKQQIIFDRFTQANPETIRKFGGTGLGLAIVKRLLELQDSQIHLESEENKGAKFYFDLKLDKYMPTLDKNKNTVDAATSNKASGGKILLVEDTKINQLVVAKFLKTWQLTIEYALNGVEAVEQAKNNHYDLILMDLQMPEMDGYEATRKIRLLPAHKNTPIIALTASALVEERERAFESGVNDYLTKPFSPNELYNKIIRHIQIDGEAPPMG
ncbi:PAS domain-containing protein [uncultured Microscilla sp.]|uniref:PAS domain-containing protein n=1 Tax=uncultured Microscilla sp. TaxID=432653 RepID=UPI00262253BE|nr:PAS domain-containing protein [uncultured Microscilla sp.]